MPGGKIYSVNAEGEVAEYCDTGQDSVWSICTDANGVLYASTGDEGQIFRIEAGEKARGWKQVVVLKGAHTVVAAPDGRTTVLPFANPGLATAGTGDVLAGAIVGLLAQGLAPFDAALCGAYLHGFAGQIVAEQMGTSGMLAGDLLPALPQAIARLKLGVPKGTHQRS